jgi:hypothetical protein
MGLFSTRLARLLPPCAKSAYAMQHAYLFRRADSTAAESRVVAKSCTEINITVNKRTLVRLWVNIVPFLPRGTCPVPARRISRPYNRFLRRGWVNNRPRFKRRSWALLWGRKGSEAPPLFFEGRVILGPWNSAMQAPSRGRPSPVVGCSHSQCGPNSCAISLFARRLPAAFSRVVGSIVAYATAAVRRAVAR